MDHPSALPSKTVLGLMLLLAAMTLALFWPATGFDFVKLDDDQYICTNPHVTTGLSSTNIRWAFTTVYEDWWAPLLWISFMADTSLFGPGPFGYHLTNILLHAANTLILFWALFRMAGWRWLSFFAAALFALHPLRVESVAWITERKDVLSGFFFMLALVAHLRQAGHPSAARRITVAVTMLLGLMAKSLLVVLPFLLLILDFWPLGRIATGTSETLWQRWRPLVAEKLPLFLLSGLFGALTILTHQTVGDHAFNPAWENRLTLVAPAYWTYLGHILWPGHLSLLYPPDSPSIFWRLLASLGLLGFTGLCWRFRKTCPALWAGWLWYLAAFFPVIRGIRFDEQSAFPDRYTYLPAIGIGLMLCGGSECLAKRWKTGVVPLIALGLAALALCAWRTTLRLPDWRNSETMFNDLIAFAPEHPFANNSYGKVLLESGRIEESLPYFTRATELGDSVAPRNYADALIRLGRDAEAIAWLEHFLSSPALDHPDGHALLGLAYLNTDRADDAIPHLKKALAASISPLGLQIALVRAAYETGDAAGVQREIHRLQDLGYPGIRDFDGLIVHYALSSRSGGARPAWLFFRNNLRRQPDNIVLLNNAAWLLATIPDAPAPAEEGLRLARHAAELATVPHPGILDTLAAALAANGRFDEARLAAQQAIALARKAGDGALATQIEQRLAVYRQNLPWRERAGP